MEAVELSDEERLGMRRAISVLSAAVEPFSGGGPETHRVLFDAVKHVLADMLQEADEGENEEKFLDSFSALLGAFVVLVDASHEAVGRHTPEEKLQVLHEIALVTERGG